MRIWCGSLIRLSTFNIRYRRKADDRVFKLMGTDNTPDGDVVVTVAPEGCLCVEQVMYDDFRERHERLP